MRRTRSSLLGVGVAVMLCASFLRAQSAECSPEDTAALLQPTDAAYSDAMELGSTLSEHGFAIRCILTSKLGGLFKSLEGAALYRTDHGDFDALFLPAPETFAELKIVERSTKKGFAYWFSGKSRAWAANRLESGHREYFLKHQNQLLILDDDQLRMKLQDALNIPGE
jgi:hypothetical protein